MKFNTYLKWTSIVALCLALFTPLIVSDSLFFPFIVGKALFFRAMVEIAFASWLLLALRDSSYRPRMSSLAWSFLAFVVVIGVADLFGQSPLKSFWSNFERMEGYITILHVFGYFFVSGIVLSTEKLWKRFFEISTFSSVIVSIYALFQLKGLVNASSGGARLDATLGNATYLAVYMLFAIFIALILLYKEHILWKRVSFALIASINTIILFNTGTRGAILGLLGGLFVTGMLVALFDKGEKKKRIIAGSIVGGVIILVLLFISVRNTDFVRESSTLGRFASISLADAKTQARYYIWPMAIDGWKEKPLLGWGQENFNYVFNTKYSPKLYGQEQWFDRAHNAPLDWLVATGSLGFLGYISLFGFALWLLWKRSSHMSFTEKSLFTGLLAGYFFNNLFVFDNTTSYLMFASILGYIHFSGTRLSIPLKIKPLKKEEFDGSDASIIGFFILALLAGSFIFCVWRPYMAAHSLLDALRSLSVQPVSPEAAIGSFEKTLSYGMIGNGETIERMVEGATQVNASGASIEIKQKYYEFAKKVITDRLEKVPGDARYELFAGSFYSTYRLFGDAEDHFIKARNLSPQKQTMYFVLGSTYLKGEKYAEAEAEFKKAYELDITNTDALNYYVSSLIYSGKEKEATDLLNENKDLVNGDILIQTYATLGKWNKVFEVLNNRIQENPNDIEVYQNLAIAYYQSGNKTQAINVFREMITLFPEFKAQAEEYIKQIQADIK